MPPEQNKLIEYFRRCYRADSYDLSIANIDKLRSDRRLLIDREDVLACGELPRLPLMHPGASVMLGLADTYRKERQLIYGCLMVKGKLNVSSGFSKQRQIHSPLLFFPARLYRDEDVYLDIDPDDLRINAPLLRLLLKPDIDPSAISSFPLITWPLQLNGIARISQWLKENTVLNSIEEIARWPALTTPSTEKNEALHVRSSCFLLLAERPKSVRGVLHELTVLSASETTSRPVQEILGQQTGAINPHAKTTRERLPGLLSSAQSNALSNAASQQLSLISGPPGTGKSYTIAAIAIDRMLNGESVLIVSKTDQAIEVVSEKLQSDFGLESGFIRGNSENFLKTVRDHLDSLLKEGVRQNTDIKSLRLRLDQTRSLLKQLEKSFAKSLLVARNMGPGTPVIKRLLAELYNRLMRKNNIWTSQERIGDYQQRFEADAISYINAYQADQLSHLLQTRRKALVTFHQALRARSSKKQAEFFAETDFDVVLQAFPIWLVSVDDVNRILPFTKELFDIVIIDEATQCDIASALPALQRARRAVVVGDRKQLRHVSFLSNQKQEELWKKSALEGKVSSGLSYRDQSLMDIASDAITSQSAVVLLDEHFRSKPELIAFSNEFFYANRLKIMQARPGVNNGDALTFTKLSGKRLASGRNAVEKDHIITVISQHISDYAAIRIKPSLGVLSPYREQAEYLDREIRKHFPAATLSDFNLRISTPYGFQGEERDVMLISMAIDNESLRAASYLNREDMFNVAITRAKTQQRVFYSIDEARLPSQNLFKRYLMHTESVRSAPSRQQALCDFSAEVKSILEEKSINVWIGYGIAGQEIDVVCVNKGHIIGIDLIGYPGDFTDYFSLTTYKTLHRAGFDIIPLPFHLWQKDKQTCLARLLKKLNISQTDHDL